MAIGGEAIAKVNQIYLLLKDILFLRDVLSILLYYDGMQELPAILTLEKADLYL
jgi:hypothetical protein